VRVALAGLAVPPGARERTRLAGTRGYCRQAWREASNASKSAVTGCA
jgi:hypothetical protein